MVGSYNECFTVNCFLSLDLEKVSDTAFHCVMVAVFVSGGAVQFQAQNLVQCRLERRSVIIVHARVRIGLIVYTFVTVAFRLCFDG